MRETICEVILVHPVDGFVVVESKYGDNAGFTPTGDSIVEEGEELYVEFDSDDFPVAAWDLGGNQVF